jgi:hypothetical protein
VFGQWRGAVFFARLLFLAKTFDCKTSLKMIPHHSTSEQARKCRGHLLQLVARFTDLLL